MTSGLAVEVQRDRTKKPANEKKRQRMRSLIRNARAIIKDARALGADVSSARELIKKAEKALERNNYHDIPLLVRNAKAEIIEAKRYFRAERMIRNVIPLLDQANEMGADISEAM
ncbi:MAG: hypothetical protein ACE5KV_09140, partial [Thermoplasmata archaeon]